MGAKSGILWTDATWNVMSGCTKISPGCKFCYAKHQAWPRLAKAPGNVYTGREFEDVRFHLDKLALPLQWQRPRKIFVNSLSDLFHEDISDDEIAATYAVMGMARHHIFQVLTKRADRAADWYRRMSWESCLDAFSRLVDVDAHPALARTWKVRRPVTWPLPNLWMGISAEDQAHYDQRIPHLMSIPAEVHWVSAEPLLSRINLQLHRAVPGPDRRLITIGKQLKWVVVGGESGWTPRPMHPVWPLDLRNQCMDSGVAFFFKQWGGYTPDCAVDLEALRQLSTTSPDHNHVVVTESGQLLAPPFMEAVASDIHIMRRVHRGHAEDALLDGEPYQEYPTVPRELSSALIGGADYPKARTHVKRPLLPGEHRKHRVRWPT